MIYQLPTGKIIYITVDQFLSLSDDELNALSVQNIGEYARSPWTESAIKRQKKKKRIEEEIDKSIDYSEENEELSREKPTFTEEILEDLPDLPDDLEEID